MKDKFYDIIPENKRSIRNIPIPNKEQKEAIEQKLTEAENSFIENVIEEQVPHVTAKDSPKKPARKASHSMDGIKKGGKKKALRTVTPEVTTEAEEEVPPLTPIPKRDIKHKDFSVEPAFETLDSPLEEEDPVSDSLGRTETYESWNRNTKKGYVFWIICGLILALLLITISYIFTGATISLVPKKYDLSVSGTKVYLSDIRHSGIKVTVKDELTVDVDGTVSVDRKASGTVVLYNAFSSAEQRLVANTRLETSGGKIFRLTKSVTIPGQKTVSGKNVPGSVEAEIVADKSGDGYNVGFQDFKLPAYKGTPRYDSIYGRSKTSVGNGYSGEVPNIGSSGIASSTKALKEKLLSLAIKDAEKKNPDSAMYALIPESYITEYGEIKQTVASNGKKVTFEGSLTLTAVFIAKDDLSKAVLKAENMIQNSTSTKSQVNYTGDTGSLRISFPKDTISKDLEDTQKMYFTVSGTSSIYTMVSEETVAQAVSNLRKDRAVPVLTELTDSPDVQIEIWPWWKNTLPSKDRIRLKIN
ncbi:MAG: hypothetical protein FGM57_01040 [Candidatus Taylorbacteria bacterium]|nr:hypothetical protein [Candidatus Taylorbacteria bacterium]